MICGGCNAIEYGAYPATDGGRVCATCPDRAVHGRDVQQSHTMRALSRIADRRDRASREAMQQRYGRTGTDPNAWWTKE